MRKALLIILASALLLICGCSKTSVNPNDDATLTFIYGEKDICISLTAEETEKVIEILNEKSYSSLFSGTPSCGFDKNISLQIGERSFAIARDTCNVVQDLGNLRYFDIPKDDMEYIHSLFEKYGGKFPCI